MVKVPSFVNVRLSSECGDAEKVYRPFSPHL